MDVLDRSVAAADPRRRVDGKSVRGLPRRDPSQRGSRRLHHARCRVPLAGPACPVRRRRPREHAAQRSPGDGAHRLGERRRQPRDDAAGQAARRPARIDGLGHDALERLPPGCHRRGAWSRDRRQHDPVPRHRRPLHAERRDLGRDALLERDDGDHEPRGDAAVGRRERRTGSGVHVRPCALGRLHATGQPGLGGPGA